MKTIVKKRVWIAIAGVLGMMLDVKTYAQTEPPVFSQAYFRYDSVEVKPSYPGGEAALQAYLNSNLQYPLPARRDSVKGEVKVWFVVEKDGKVSNVKVLGGIGKGCDEEAKRLVMNMPPWTAGLYKGKIVATEVVINVEF